MFYFQSNLPVLKSQYFLTKLKTYKLPHHLIGIVLHNRRPKAAKRETSGAAYGFLAYFTIISKSHEVADNYLA